MNTVELRPVEQMLIRACKSTNPRQRLQSVYRRFYLASGQDLSGHCAIQILYPVIDKACPMSAITAIVEMRRCVHNGMTDDWDFADILISHIRWSSTDEIKGYRKPARFRNK